MGLCLVNIHGDIEGDYEIVKEMEWKDIYNKGFKDGYTKAVDEATHKLEEVIKKYEETDKSSLD